MNLHSLFENVSEEKCPHCNGPMFSELMINEKKDACYYKVKSRYKVWPSAYASGALVKCRKKGADSWGNKSESVAEDQLDENLRQWFKEKWVRFGPDGKIRGDCARGDDSEGKPKCLPQAKAHALGKKGRASAAARKRREDPNPERRGTAHNVATKSEGVAEGKVKLHTDPGYFGAEVDDTGFDSLPVVNIPTNQLVGFEPDSKMNQPKSKVNVEKIVAGLKQGAKLPPLLVRKYKNGYQVLDGHHRFWAYKLLGVKSIPSRIVPDEDIEEISKQGVAEGSLNELSKDTLKSYAKKAVPDMQASQKRSEIEAGKAASTKDDKTAKTHYDAAKQAKDRTEKRMAGISGAIKRVTNQGVAEAQTDYQRRRQRERDVDAGKPVKPPPKNPQNDYFARRKKERDLAEDQPVQLSPNISARPNQDPDSPEDWDYYYKDMHVAPGQDFHTQIKDQHLRQMDPAYNTMRAAFDNPTKPGPATPYKEPTGDTIIPSRPQAPEKMKDIEGNPVRLRDYVPGDPRISESRLYYNVIGTADKDLRSEFGMRKDRRGWYLNESSSPKYKMMAQRAFGSPKLQEYNFPAGQATTGSEGVISPVGSIPHSQINKR